MILNTGNKTDIPAFFAEWFFNRLQDGYVDVLNPYAKDSTKTYWRYQINPSVVDVIAFTTKNPKPMIENKVAFNHLLSTYPTFWFMTITPYSSDIERNVPNMNDSIQSFQELSMLVGKERLGWRFDPILFGNGWDIGWIVRSFADIALSLNGFTTRVTISFLDKYQKVNTNAPWIKRPDEISQTFLVKALVDIAKQNNMELYICHDKNPDFLLSGANISGCASLDLIAESTGLQLFQKKKHNARENCSCVLSADIGQYNTCLHECLYCYATCNHTLAKQMYQNHEKDSSCLIGHVTKEDTIVNVKQASWRT